ncbi:MAG: hypothetical protein HY803_15920 [candidate division NC10 bacterium]|nr:hypothetical protein [candidate division NC10 bacterium]
MKPGASSRQPPRAVGATPQTPIQFEFDAGAGRHRVWGTAFVSHEGLAVNLVGGDVPHIGAVAISIPRPSRADARRRSATTSIFALLGHKEDDRARPFAASLAQALGRTTVVVAGVHIRRAGPADIAKVFENAGRAVETIIARVKAPSRDRRRAAGPKCSTPVRRRSPDPRLRERT